MSEISSATFRPLNWKGTGCEQFVPKTIEQQEVLELLLQAGLQVLTIHSASAQLISLIVKLITASETTEPTIH